MEIKYIKMNVEYFAMFVYVSPQKALQVINMWHELLRLDPKDKPWTILGDFNNIINVEEKWGGNQSTNVHINNFINFLNAGKLILLDASSVPFYVDK